MALKAFENVNHVGGVVTTAEEDKMANLFKLINNQIKTRKRNYKKKVSEHTKHMWKPALQICRK